MASPRMRPVFEHPLAQAPQEFLDALRHRLAAATGRPGEVKGQVFARGAILRLCDAERRVWSPALHLAIEPVPGHALFVVRGTFSPSSPVWTAFLAIYLVLACGGIGAACWGGAQLTMHEAPWAFLGVPIALALAGFTYGAAFIGQGLGGEDMFMLRNFVERLADATQGTAATAASRTA